jgi:hypothetical protein
VLGSRFGGLDEVEDDIHGSVIAEDIAAVVAGWAAFPSQR